MSNAKLSFTQAWNDRIAISSAGGDEPAVYRFDSNLPKACFHPLTTPSGHHLTGFEMSDHVWHRGLWFTIKFINGTNFWEEHEPFGIQQPVAQPSCQTVSADRISIWHSLNWTSQATGIVLREDRTLTYRSHSSGICSVDWSTDLHAKMDLLLDRTPYTTWGGYGGLSFRASRELHDVSFILPDGESAPGLAGQSHDWVMMHAAVDGKGAPRVSLAIVDHPANPRSPSPWYCKTGNGFTYMNAAFLFHESLVVKKDQTLSFRYQVLYRDGTWTTNEIQSLAKEFRESEASR
jgi:hypothetical protein